MHILSIILRTWANFKNILIKDLWVATLRCVITTFVDKDSGGRIRQIIQL